MYKTLLDISNRAIILCSQVNTLCLSTAWSTGLLKCLFSSLDCCLSLNLRCQFSPSGMS